MTELSHAELSQMTWLTTRQAAKYTGRHIDTLKRAATSGEIKSSQTGRGGWHRFHRAELDDWMRTKTTARAAAS